MGRTRLRSFEQELKQVKEAIASVIKSAFKDIYDLISHDEKMFDFFAPQLKEFEKIVLNMSEGAELIRTNRDKILRIQQRLNDLALPGRIVGSPELGL